MSQIAKVDGEQALAKVILEGDLSKLSPTEKVTHYKRVCESCGLNPLTQPFSFIRFQGREVLYAGKNCTEQLRDINGISLKIIARDKFDDLYVVTAEATNKQGRSDSSTGAVNLKGLSGDALANAVMKAECVPLDYQILTKEGFKFYYELEDLEEVASYDIDSNQLKWVKLIEYKIYKDRLVTEYSNNVARFEFTEGHKWVSVKDGSYKLKEFEDIPLSSYILLSSLEKETKSNISPKLAAALGWLITDGTIKKYKGNLYRASICQSKEENFSLIDDALSELGEITKGCTDNRERNWMNQHWWYLSKAQTKILLHTFGFESFDDLPKIAANMSFECREAMIKAMMLADGDIRGNFGKGNIKIIECFQILCTLNGIVLSQMKTRIFKNSTKPFYLVRKLSYNKISKNYLQQEESRICDVWCPTTCFGTWIMRSPDGQIAITGNTKAKRRVTLSIAGLGFLDESEADSIPNAQLLSVDMSTGEIIDSKLASKSNVTAIESKSDLNIDKFNGLYETFINIYSEEDMVSAVEFWRGLEESYKKAIWKKLTADQQQWLRGLLDSMKQKE